MHAPTSLLDILSQLRAKRKVAADEVARIEADIKALERAIELAKCLDTGGQAVDGQNQRQEARR